MPEAQQGTKRASRPASPPTPSVSRLVHYTTDPGGATRAALITDVHEDGSTADLLIFNQVAPYVHPLPGVPYSAEPSPGHYNWPPRA